MKMVSGRTMKFILGFLFILVLLAGTVFTGMAERLNRWSHARQEKVVVVEFAAVDSVEGESSWRIYRSRSAVVDVPPIGLNLKLCAKASLFPALADVWEFGRDPNLGVPLVVGGLSTIGFDGGGEEYFLTGPGTLGRQTSPRVFIRENKIIFLLRLDEQYSLTTKDAYLVSDLPPPDLEVRTGDRSASDASGGEFTCRYAIIPEAADTEGGPRIAEFSGPDVWASGNDGSFGLRRKLELIGSGGSVWIGAKELEISTPVQVRVDGYVVINLAPESGVYLVGRARSLQINGEEQLPLVLSSFVSRRVLESIALMFLGGAIHWMYGRLKKS